jgi:hypothetical protein
VNLGHKVWRFTSTEFFNLYFFVLNVIICLMGSTMPIAHKIFGGLRSKVLGV